MAEAHPQNIGRQTSSSPSGDKLTKPRGYHLCILIDVASVALYLCGFCEFVLRLPCQVECGHQFCEDCLRHRLQASSSVECPLCAKESDTSLITMDNFHPDFACRKQMRKMTVNCENKNMGCPWQKQFKFLDAHLAECNYARIECVDCQLVVIRSELDEHLRDDCLGAPLDVSGPCIFGCRDLPADVDIDLHYQEKCAEHLDILLKEYKKMKRMRNRIGKLSDKVSTLSNTREVERQVERTDTVTTDVDEVIANLKKMDSATKASTNLINLAFKEVQRVATRLVDLEKLFQAQFLASSTGELPARLREMNSLNEELSKRITSYDGVLLWEITGVKGKMEQAKRSGASIDSPAFCTGQTGYKLMARLYFNGDGSGKDRYISLFVVVLKGKSDGAVNWPLKHFIVFTLFDRSGNRKHHKFSFCTDPSSSSFARPQQAANIASGCPQFISQQEFNQRYDQFVQEDEMILEVRVDRSVSAI